MEILSGSFPHRVDYVIKGFHLGLLYFLANGIFPNYVIFVKIISNGGNTKKFKSLSAAQEEITKNLERAFGILIAVWHHYIVRLKYTWCTGAPITDLALRIYLQSCQRFFIMHNMVVENLRDDYDSNMFHLKLLDDPAVQSFCAENMRYSRIDTLPIRDGFS